MAILTVEELKDYSIKVTDQVVAQALLDTAIEACCNYAGVSEGTIEEWFDGGTDSVALTYAPILNIDSVEIAGNPIIYRFDRRAYKLVFMNPIPRSRNILKVSYTCGWNGKAPAGLRAAVALTVQHMLKLTNGKLMGTLSRTTDGGSEQIEQTIPPLAVKGLLEHYRGNVL